MLMPDGKYKRSEGLYTYEGREFISTTTALKEVGLSPQYPDRAFFAAWRGTKVHDAVEKLLTEPCDEDAIKKIFVSLDDVAGRGYLAAFLKFLRECRFELAVENGIKLAEKGICHPFYGYAGRFDIAGFVNGKRAVVDVKTGLPMPWHGPQIASYVLGLWGGPEDVDRYGLYLKSNGTYKLKPYEDVSDFAVFTSAVVIAKWKRRHGVAA